MQQGTLPLALLTSVAGFATGVYVYFTTLDAVPTVPLPAGESTSFEVTSDEYGACGEQSGCVSFRIDEDGSYTHIIYRRDGASRAEGKLDDQEKRALVSNLRETDLVRIERRSVACDLDRESATKYVVRIGSVTSAIDTCFEDMPDPLGSSLENFKKTRVWQY